MPKAKLKRTLTLPLLVFYGVGVTIGAGIFALIGEILGVAGALAPFSFLVAGAIAGATGISYALLVRVYPRAGGEAIFVTKGVGPFFGRLVGIGVAITGIISSAVIALAFAGYVNVLVAIPVPVLVIAIVTLLTGIACYGVRESVLFAAAITVLELGTLVILVAFGVDLIPHGISLSFGELSHSSVLAMSPVLAGSIIAFFAFIGFEDIENMAEETLDPSRTAPRAIFWTLGITIVVYVALSLIAVAVPGREEIAASSAPLALLFEKVTGLPSEGVAVVAAIAMINGILIQIVMAARVLYGMANEALLPSIFGRVHPTLQTPVIATLGVAITIIVLALSFPLLSLATLTSTVTIAVFALVNFSLFTLGKSHEDIWLQRMRWWGLGATLLCLAILAYQLSVTFNIGQ